ncbi:MAG: deoxyribose-phosphate aldolase [Bacteroidetes bacterium]|nr:deoxyribose-phosphate aldolase [Bacteroidota bacterium]
MPLNKYIDHTILKPTCLVSDIEKLCAEAKQYDFAAVCVPPNFVKLAKEKMAGSTVKVATVIGFPFGYSATEAKIAEIILAMVDGADELDVVANISAIKNGDWSAIADEINHILPIIRSKNKVVKIIIESGVLTDDEIIKCCDIYGIAGIDYLKTSTGYAEKGASVEAVKLFRKHLPDQVQIKASGGIRDYATAKLMIDAGATRIGCSAGVVIVSGAIADNVKSNY